MLSQIVLQVQLFFRAYSSALRFVSHPSLSCWLIMLGDFVMFFTKYALEQPRKCVDVVAGADDVLGNGDGFIFRRRTQLGDPNTAACSAFIRVDAAPVASL